MNELIHALRFALLEQPMKKETRHVLDAEIDKAIEWRHELHSLLEQLACDLEDEINDRYNLAQDAIHPALKHKYERDMTTVNRAREFIAALVAPPANYD